MDIKLSIYTQYGYFEIYMQLSEIYKIVLLLCNFDGQGPFMTIFE